MGTTDDTQIDEGTAPTTPDRLRQIYHLNTGRNSSSFGSTMPPSPSIMEPPSAKTSDSMRRASAVMLDLGEKRSRHSIIDVRDTVEISPLLQSTSSFGENRSNNHQHYDAIPEEEGEGSSTRRAAAIKKRQQQRKTKDSGNVSSNNAFLQGIGQIPAIALACLLNLMVGIPFGVSYFPIGWAGAESDGADDEDGIGGPFPLPDRVALGLRMFLFSTIMGQLAFTAASKFTNPIALQMVENVPFYHALAFIVIEEQGYGKDALSTLFFIFGASSMLVGAVFYALGKMEYGRIVYFFPSHVLVGCIGGIGVFILVTSVEVTLNMTFTLTSLESWKSIWDQMDLFGIVLAFEVVLKTLDYFTHDAQGRPRFPLLAPIYFCLITPLFYLGLKAFDMSMEEAEDSGYFFPSAAASSCDTSDASCIVSGSSLFGDDLLEIFQIIDFRTISWTAVAKCVPTMVALAAFSLIHVPINIPAFGISTDVDTDMNAELIAHGWSNFFSGIFGGLQNYMTYSNSVLYAKSGGQGQISSLCVSFLTVILFIVGPQIVAYIPRCMAGTLLFHIGIDLFLEGVLDSYGNYDNIEYGFVWVITVVMTLYGMTAALIAGIIAAMSTYAAQSIAHHNPIRGFITASTLRSSSWNRSNEALRILDDPQKGRSRILILQLQGHLFFGTCAQITDTMKAILNEKKGTPEEPWVVIMDFTLVIGMDSSAAHAIAKLKKVMHKAFHVEVTIFVTGSGEGFPCEFALSHELSKACEEQEMVDWNDVSDSNLSMNGNFEDRPLVSRGAISLSAGSPSLYASIDVAKHPKERVCESLDCALIFAEDMLIARANEGLLRRDQIAIDPVFDDPDEMMSIEEEKHYAFKYLKNLCPNTAEADVKQLLSLFQREEYREQDVLWKQGAASSSAKILIQGTITSYLEGTTTTESVSKGNMLGELGLVHGTERLSTVVCSSDKVIAYSLSLEAWEALVEKEPRIARLMDCIVIRYLAHRVQHVSNRIFETRCLPI